MERAKYMKECDKALTELNKLFRGELATKYQQLLPPTQQLIAALMNVRINLMTEEEGENAPNQNA